MPLATATRVHTLPTYGNLIHSHPHGVASLMDGASSMSIEPWVTLKEVSQHLQVSDETIHRWITSKGLPAHRAGRVWRFKLSEVDAWIRSGSAAADESGQASGDLGGST